MKELEIKKGQIFKAKRSGLQIEVAGKKDSKWLCKILTTKPGVYAGSHRMSEYVLRQQFILLS